MAQIAKCLLASTLSGLFIFLFGTSLQAQPVTAEEICGPGQRIRNYRCEPDPFAPKKQCYDMPKGIEYRLKNALGSDACLCVKRTPPPQGVESCDVGEVVVDRNFCKDITENIPLNCQPKIPSNQTGPAKAGLSLPMNGKKVAQFKSLNLCNEAISDSSMQYCNPVALCNCTWKDARNKQHSEGRTEADCKKIVGAKCDGGFRFFTIREKFNNNSNPELSNPEPSSESDDSEGVKQTPQSICFMDKV